MVLRCLGQFGDRRLEKGGCFCTIVSFRRALAVSGFGDWVAGGLERFA